MRRLLLGLLLVATTALVLARPAGAAGACSASDETCSPTTTAVEPIQPRATEGTSPPYVMIALTTVLVAGGCLYLLLRRGSIAHRAREDEERPSGA